jgi:hypothetical protein
MTKSPKILEDRKGEDGDLLTFLDIFKEDKFSWEEIRESFEENFGSISGKAKEEENKNMNSFREIISEAQDILEDDLWYDLDPEFKKNLDNLATRKGIYDFLGGKNNFEGRQAEIKALLKIAATIKYGDKNFKVELENLDEKLVELGTKINNTLPDKDRQRKEIILKIGEEEIHLSDPILNSKARKRIILKLLRKPELKIENIPDLLRVRIIIKEEEEGIDNFSKYLINNFSSINLEEKGDTGNISKDKTRKGLVLIGKLRESGVEIQIIPKKNYKESEEGPKHHSVYQFIQKIFIRERMMETGIDSEKIREKIEALASSKEIQNSKIDNEYSKGELKKIIWERFNKYFFRAKSLEGETKYFSYEKAVKYRQEQKDENEYILDGLAENLSKYLPQKEETEDKKNQQKLKKCKFSKEEIKQVFTDLESVESLDLLLAIIKFFEENDNKNLIIGISKKFIDKIKEEFQNRTSKSLK